jgi:hypothetical protein
MMTKEEFCGKFWSLLREYGFCASFEQCNALPKSIDALYDDLTKDMPRAMTAEEMREKAAVAVEHHSRDCAAALRDNDTTWEEMQSAMEIKRREEARERRRTGKPTVVEREEMKVAFQDSRPLDCRRFRSEEYLFGE